MVNFGLNAAAILGLFLAVAGAGLFFLRSIRPELARDYDIFFAAVGLLCGIILLFNGWRLDPILQFGQFLLTGTSIFFAFESIRMRGVATEQARRNTPIVDRDRPVSRTRVYTEAELDKIDPYDNYEGTPNYNSPRLRGYDDPQPRSARRTTEPRRSSPPPSMDVRDEPRRTPSRNRPETNDYPSRDSEVDNRFNYNDRPSRPRRRPSPEATDAYDNWNANDEWDDNSNSTPRSRPRPRPTTDENSEVPTPPVSRRRQNPADLGRTYQDPQDDYDAGSLRDNRDFNRPSDDLGRSYQDEDKSTSIPGDYVVDYQPIENLGTDYTDDYDDLGEDDDDNYNNNQDDNTDDYQDYQRPSGKRQPINFNDYE
ncbi:hypothetical protein NIES4102_09980 [Chondrocystis sp. NIES-4102]|nr:hypothetical protein NIES4102_09980 [Chondrocystis sp. NIES-4102]